MNRVLGVLLGTLALLLACTGLASAATPSAAGPVLADETTSCSNNPGSVNLCPQDLVGGALNTVTSETNKIASDLRVRCTPNTIPVTPLPVGGHYCSTNGNGNHFPGRGNHFPGHGGPVGLPRYDSCGDYNLHGIRDIRRGDARYLDRLDRDRDGIACDGNDTTVIVAGDGSCDSLNTVLVSDGNSYRDVYGRYNTLRDRYLRDRSVSTLRDWRSTYNQYNDLRGRYLAQRQRTVVVCQNNTAPDVVNNYTVTQTPDQACGCNSSAGVAPASDNPTSLGSGGPQVYTAPKGGAEAGDGSTCTEVRRF